MGTQGITNEEEMDIKKEAKLQEELEHLREAKILKRWVTIAEIDKHLPELPVEEIKYDEEPDTQQPHQNHYGPFLELALQGPTINNAFKNYMQLAKERCHPPKRNEHNILVDEKDEGWTSQGLSIHFQ